MGSDLFHLSSARLVLLSGALLFAGACGRTGQLTVVIDSSWSRDGLEVVFVPVDPASILAESSPRTSAAQADSLATLATLEDSAATLDAEFSRLRDQLNAESRSLAAADRRSSDYARRYDEFRPRADQAEALRSARDRLRSKAASLRVALAPLLPDSARLRERSESARGKLSRARDGTRAARTVRVAMLSLPVRLAEGEWFAGLARDGLAPAAFRKVSVAAGMRDTLTFGPRTR